MPPQNDILKRALLVLPSVAVLASEEDESPVASASPGGRFAVVFDPLDGSRNIEVSIPTGTIFGVYECDGAGASRQSIVHRVWGGAPSSIPCYRSGGFVARLLVNLVMHEAIMVIAGETQFVTPRVQMLRRSCERSGFSVWQTDWYDLVDSEPRTRN